jgi:hypothetical protein
VNSGALSTVPMLREQWRWCSEEEEEKEEEEGRGAEG